MSEGKLTFAMVIILQIGIIVSLFINESFEIADYLGLAFMQCILLVAFVNYKEFLKDRK